MSNTTLPLSLPPPEAIDTLPDDPVLARIAELSSQAILNADLSLIFGSNGKSGRSATGNFSLLAKATGLSRCFIGKVLRGKATPSYDTLRKIEGVTGIGLSEISQYIQDQRKLLEKAA